MHVVWKFTGDGILAFAGGALALFGIWLSNRQSVRNVQKQLDSEKQARKDEQERRSKAVATAILFEIDYICRYFVRDVEISSNLQGISCAIALMRNKIDRSPFIVYEASAGVLGTLDERLVEDIVHLYGNFAVYVTTLNELARAINLQPESLIPWGSDAHVSVLVGVVQATIPSMKQQAAGVCKHLCDFTGVLRERIAALASDPSNAQTY